MSYKGRGLLLPEEHRGPDFTYVHKCPHVNGNTCILEPTQCLRSLTLTYFLHAAGVLLDPLYVRRLLDTPHPPRANLLDVLYRARHALPAGADLQNATLQTGQVRQHLHH